MTVYAFVFCCFHLDVALFHLRRDSDFYCNALGGLSGILFFAFIIPHTDIFNAIVLFAIQRPQL
jgi:hypothetical protein